MTVASSTKFDVSTQLHYILRIMLKFFSASPNQAPALNHAAEPSLYERDFNLWIEEQVRLLKARHFDALDLENVIEELDSMGRSDKRSMTSHFDNLLMHFLKYRYQPDQRSTSWRGSIRELRKQVDRIIKDSPSLRPYLTAYATQSKTYKYALIQATDETGLPASTFPPELPFTLDELLDDEFWPE